MWGPLRTRPPGLSAGDRRIARGGDFAGGVFPLWRSRISRWVRRRRRILRVSGYLITSLIQSEIENGKFSLAHFYARRVRRIFPALFAMLAIVSAVAFVVLFPVDLRPVCAEPVRNGAVRRQFRILARGGIFRRLRRPETAAAPVVHRSRGAVLPAFPGAAACIAPGNAAPAHRSDFRRARCVFWTKRLGRSSSEARNVLSASHARLGADAGCAFRSGSGSTVALAAVLGASRRARAYPDPGGNIRLLAAIAVSRTGRTAALHRRSPGDPCGPARRTFIGASSRCARWFS